MTSVKQFKQESQQSNLYKKKQETSNMYEPHQHITTEHQVKVDIFLQCMPF